MKLIGAVVDVNAEGAVTSATVSDRWPLCRGASVDPLVLIELVAQTAGIHVSWKRGEDKGVNAVGWIVGIKEADFLVDEVPLGAVLTTAVKALYSAENYNVLEGTVSSGRSLLGRVQIQVYRGDVG